MVFPPEMSYLVPHDGKILQDWHKSDQLLSILLPRIQKLCKTMATRIDNGIKAYIPPLSVIPTTWRWYALRSLGVFPPMITLILLRLVMISMLTTLNNPSLGWQLQIEIIIIEGMTNTSIYAHRTTDTSMIIAWYIWRMQVMHVVWKRGTRNYGANISKFGFLAQHIRLETWRRLMYFVTQTDNHTYFQSRANHSANNFVVLVKTK